MWLEVRNNTFIEQGCETVSRLLESKLKEVQENYRLSTACRNPTSIPLFYHQNDFYSVLQFKGVHLIVQLGLF